MTEARPHNRCHDGGRDTMQKYRVELHSKAGPWACYDGHVEVLAEDENDAVERALSRLKRTAFPDRPRNSWSIDGVQRVE